MKKLLMLSLALLCAAGLTSSMFAVTYDQTYTQRKRYKKGKRYKTNKKPYKMYKQQIHKKDPMLESYMMMEDDKKMDNNMVDAMDDSMNMDTMMMVEEN